MTTPRNRRISGSPRLRKDWWLKAVWRPLKSLSALALLSLFSCPLLADEGTILINEIQVANVDRFVDPSWNYGGWIELYNTGTSQINLRGYWVSDDPANLKKAYVSQSVLLRAGGFANLWFDHHDKYCPSQIAMKLDTEGGTVYLSDRQGRLVASQDYPPAIARSSWARLSDGAGEWAYCDRPTPHASNGKVVPCYSRVEAPQPDRPSCIFEGTLPVHVGIPEGATLRFTTDGSTPTQRNGQTSTDGQFNISKTTILRLACYRDGYLGSQVVTRSYLLKDKSFSLPVVVIASDPDHFYSDELGIFVKGVNGRPGLGQTDPCNWNMDWDRPVNFDYLDAEGNSLLNQEAEIKRSGGWGRFQMPFSFKIHAAKIYEGRNSMDYPFFEDKPYIKSKALLMRNGGNCDYQQRVRDAFLQKLVLSSGIDMDAQDYQPVAHYLNDVYKGVLNLREPNNKHFVFSNYGLDEEEIDMFVIDNDTGYVQKCGTHDALGELYELSKTAEDDETYRRIERMVDIDEMCYYLAIQFYLGNGDWPNNNMKAWRERSENGRWRYLLYDLDGTFNRTTPFTLFEAMRIHTFNTLLGEPISNFTKEIEPVTIWLNLLKNEHFRRRFTDAFCLVAGSVFEPKRCEALIRAWAERVYPMQILGDNGYGRNNSPWPAAEYIITRLNTQAQDMYEQLRTYERMGLKGITPMKVGLRSNIPEGCISLNGQQVPTGAFEGKLFPPVTLKAEAPGGYVFDGWYLSAGSEVGGAPLFQKGEEWSYYDGGSLDGKLWRRASYGTGDWKAGRAPFGYGKASGGYRTTLDYGTDASSKRTTYYFRKFLKLSEKPGEDDILRLSYAADDGFVVYVNNVEAGRYNMPQGSLNYATLATTYADTDPATGYIDLKGNLFNAGLNLIAVEVHNCATTSSDIYWDAQLSRLESTGGMVSKDPEYTLESGNAELVAHFSRAETHCPVVVNEVSASNSVYVNEYYKKRDWVELYNCTDADIDLAGMYLSDDASDPHKYAISSTSLAGSTIIPARGHKIIWCDEMDPLNHLHAPFKLGNEDNEMVILTARDDSWADTLVYCRHDGTYAVGRFPDGSANVYLTPRPTIERTNRLHANAEFLGSPSSEKRTDIEFLRQGGYGISYTGGMLSVRSEEAGAATLAVYTLDGKMVMQRSVSLESGGSRIDIGLLRPGLYVARLITSNGMVSSCKFLKFANAK